MIPAMNRESLLRWSYAMVLTKRRYERLILAYGAIDHAPFTEETLRAIGCRPDAVQKTLKRMENIDVATIERSLHEHGVGILSCEDSAYPSALNPMNDPPVFLFYKGSIECLVRPCIALVGTRKMSMYGRRVVQNLVPDLVRAGVVTISGLAHGVDGEVARTTLAEGGTTVAVLAHGLSTIYPNQHRALSQAIVDGGGLLLSEFPMDVRPDSFMFPARNRIIAGLSLATVVVEASSDSGSLITADLALDYNREVLAVPGQIFDSGYAGCNQLISEGRAHMAQTSEDILLASGLWTGGAKHAKAICVPENDTEAALLSVLTAMPQTIDDLMELTSLPPHDIIAALTMLELRGGTQNIGEGRWVSG